MSCGPHLLHGWRSLIALKPLDFEPLYFRSHIKFTLIWQRIDTHMVEMWSQHVLGGPYVDNDVDTLLVFNSFYRSNAIRDYLNQHKVKYVGAFHSNRLKVQCDMLRRKVRKGGDCAGTFNKSIGKIIMQYYAKGQQGQKEAKIRTAIMSNAYRRFARPGTHHHRPAIDAYKIKVGVCDLFNRQIRHRIWPHRHGGKGTRGKRGKKDSCALRCILLNTFSAYLVDYDYYSFCEQLADRLDTYALT